MGSLEEGIHTEGIGRRWLDLVDRRLTAAGHYALADERVIAKTTVRTYRPFISPESRVEAAVYTAGGELLQIDYLHPRLVALTDYWCSDLQYFEDGMFDDPPEFGDPGLKWREPNLRYVEALLAGGIRGVERQLVADGSVDEAWVEFEDPGLGRVERRWRRRRGWAFARTLLASWKARPTRELVEIDLGSLFPPAGEAEQAPRK